MDMKQKPHQNNINIANLKSYQYYTKNTINVEAAHLINVKDKMANTLHKV